MILETNNWTVSEPFNCIALQTKRLVSSHTALCTLHTHILHLHTAHTLYTRHTLHTHILHTGRYIQPFASYLSLLDHLSEWICDRDYLQYHAHCFYENDVMFFLLFFSFAICVKDQHYQYVIHVCSFKGHIGIKTWTTPSQSQRNAGQKICSWVFIPSHSGRHSVSIRPRIHYQLFHGREKRLLKVTAVPHKITKKLFFWK